MMGTEVSVDEGGSEVTVNTSAPAVVEVQTETVVTIEVLVAGPQGPAGAPSTVQGPVGPVGPGMPAGDPSKVGWIVVYTGPGPNDYTLTDPATLGWGSGPSPITYSGGAAPDATVGTPYSHTWSLAGGTAPYTLTPVALPAGITAALSGSTITLSGTPTASGTAQAITLNVDDSGSAPALTISDSIDVAPSAVWTPAALFGGGVSGYAYDPFDYSTMFQDSAGTTPVTGNTQPLGKLNDLSGNDAHRTQATSARRPVTTAQGYELDGTDDGMSCPTNTAAGGAWTHIIKLSVVGGDPRYVIISGYPSGSGGYFFYGESGSAGGTNGAITVNSISVDGSSVANNTGTLHTALSDGSPHVVVTKVSEMTESQWDNVVWLSGYATAQAAIKVGREIFINRDLTPSEIAQASAWVAGS